MQFIMYLLIKNIIYILYIIELSQTLKILVSIFLFQTEKFEFEIFETSTMHQVINFEFLIFESSWQLSFSDF